MFGIRFLLHKNLRRILSDYGFLGHPLKKDFPLLGFIELKFDDLFQSIAITSTESMQNFRLFQFDNP